MVAETHVEDSNMGSLSIHTHDTDTSILVAGSSISGNLSTRLYVDNFEIDINQSLQKETVSPRSCTLDFDMVPIYFQEIDNTHDDIISTPNSGLAYLQLLAGRGFDGEIVEGNNEVVVSSTHPNMSCESYFDDGSTRWSTLDHLGFPQTQLGEFHFDCILRCTHEFVFNPHTQDLTMTLMRHRDGLNTRCQDSIQCDMFQILDDESKFFRSLTLSSQVGCFQLQKFETWTLGGIRVAQWNSIDVEVEGLPFYSCDLSGEFFLRVWMQEDYYCRTWS